MTDNGFIKIVYEISINEEKINVFYNYMTHSEIIENFDELQTIIQEMNLCILAI
jgi:hypothetical protein